MGFAPLSLVDGRYFAFFVARHSLTALVQTCGVHIEEAARVVGRGCVKGAQIYAKALGQPHRTTHHGAAFAASMAVVEEMWQTAVRRS